MDLAILRFDSIDSTNLEALRQASTGAQEGLVVIAAEQTAGRGRSGRKWVSEKGSGLYLTIVLYPRIEAQYLALITLMSAVSVADALVAEFGITPDIKWPNDLLVNEKKICGILAETAETPRGLAVVVGIGVNIRPSELAPEFAAEATSLEAEIGAAGAADGSSGGAATVEERAEAAILRFFDYWYRILQEKDGPKFIIDAWRERSTYFSGKRVTASIGNSTVVGMTDGLEPSGALRIRTDSDKLVIVRSGDVRRLRQQGISD